MTNVKNMKKLFILITLVSLLLSGCNGQSKASNDFAPDSVCTADSVIEVDSKTKLSIEIKTYEKTRLLLADYEPRNIYHENSISIEWPESAEGINLDSLQKALKSMLPFEGQGNVRKIVDRWCDEMFADGGYDWEYTEVKEREDKEVNEEADSIMQYDTECSFNLVFDGIDTLHHIISFTSTFHDNNGCGMGACIFYTHNYLNYDYIANKEITVDDLFLHRSKAAQQMKKQCISLEDYDDFDGLERQTDVPDKFFIMGDTVYFTFEKYEITYGAAGCPSVGFDIRKCPEILTDYGKKLFGIKEDETLEHKKKPITH